MLQDIHRKEFPEGFQALALFLASLNSSAQNGGWL
jgi:hypothetical protein